MESTLPSDVAGTNTGSEVAVHPNGGFIYVSNRGADTIAIFAVNARNSRITPVEQTPSGGSGPRSLVIDPMGSHLLVGNEVSDNLTAFSVDAQTGHLQPVGTPVDIGSTASIVFVPHC